MAYQKLFEAIINVTGFTPLESDMFEIINAYKKDVEDQTKILSNSMFPEVFICPNCEQEARKVSMGFICDKCYSDV